MENTHNSIFILGGHDLEMLEIRKILESGNLIFYDFNLDWGAKLSSYLPVFDDSSTFVGIELIMYIEPPLHYIEIDHHNEKHALPSSIKQLAEMLNISLNRWQLLVAANDRGYIPAMQAMGANKKEVCLELNCCNESEIEDIKENIIRLVI
ncbi:MAG: hypothetical protein NTU44_15850 [Bacteroidetes bacterium]|nr:hypothetical protein [Bacteroidota bacterium]